jgi:hypothetical protein
MSSYLSRMHYNMIDNISDTFGATGIYSYPFSKVFSEISFLISNDI